MADQKFARRRAGGGNSGGGSADGSGSSEQPRRARDAAAYSWLPSGVRPKTVRTMATAGLIMGIATCAVGLRPETEMKAWGAVFAVWLAGLVWFAPYRPAATGLGAGVMCGFYTGLTQMLLFDWYTRSNPWYAEELKSGSKLRVQLTMMGTALGAGLACGTATGIVAQLLIAACGRLKTQPSMPTTPDGGSSDASATAQGTARGSTAASGKGARRGRR